MFFPTLNKILAVLTLCATVSPFYSVWAQSPESTPDTFQQQLVNDWQLQDFQAINQSGSFKFSDVFKSQTNSDLEQALVSHVFSALKDKGESFKSAFESLKSVSGNDSRWLELYTKACYQRRLERLQIVNQTSPKIVFTKHYNMGGSHYAYTEGLSDAAAERNFKPGSQLCLLEINDKGDCTETVLLEDKNGVIRDPDVSFDGDYIVFAWKKSDRLDDYHLYKMELSSTNNNAQPSDSSPAITQLTFGLGYADYEPCCLPEGDIIFNSTRCIQSVDCWFTEVSNLYRINKDGKFLRRVTTDQVHDNYPTLTEKGNVIYTRWDYNDRGQIFPQGLFQMSLDGSGQTAVYGNNSWFPTSILHARGIPGTGKMLCVFSGHHCRQRGKLGVIDPRLGSEEATGAKLAAPMRDTEPAHIDSYGQNGEQFCYPYPLTENDCLVAYRPNPNGDQKDSDPFSIFYMDMDGNRELLASDLDQSCNQPIALKAKELLFERPSQSDPTLDYSTYYVQNVFIGPGLEGIDRKQVRSLRVVELQFRPFAIGQNNNGGPAGGALVSSPISIGNGSWDVKRILGETPIYEDGSACFTVPPRTPVYFQVIDTNGQVIQSMRSWSSLQPGERFSCLGCHEDKNMGTRINVARGITQAMRRGAQPLTPFYGSDQPFSFAKQIQPILDKHCIKCHDNPNRRPPFIVKDNSTSAENSNEHPYSLLSTPIEDQTALRVWSTSYWNLTACKDTKKADGHQTPVVNWVNVQSAPPMFKPYSFGSAESKLCSMFSGNKPHNDVQLSQEEKDKIAAWVDLAVPYFDTYNSDTLWSENQKSAANRLIAKRNKMTQLDTDNFAAWLKSQSHRRKSDKAETPIADSANPYRNVALHATASSNSVYHNEDCFKAENAVNGNKNSKGHGKDFPSWGPDKDAKDLFLNIDFGRTVKIDQMVVYLRSDIPHDGYFKEFLVKFSNGDYKVIHLEPTDKGQILRFPIQKCDSVRLEGFKPADDKWPAITEVEFYGIDAE